MQTLFTSSVLVLQKNLRLVLLLALLSSSVGIAEPGLWRGGVDCDSGAGTNAPDRHKQDWLVLDSGGSGAGFGKGNIRKNLNSVSFWNKRIGTAAGDFGAYRTVDGGFTWKQLVAKYPRMVAVGLKREEWVGFKSVQMTGPDEIWLGGAEYPIGPGKGSLLYSADAGQTWQEMLEGKLSDVLEVTVLPDGSIWVLTGRQDSFCRFGRGRWRKAGFPNGFRAYTLEFPGDVPYTTKYVGYAVGNIAGSPAVAKTLDAGQTWQRLDIPSGVTRLRQICFVSSMEGWIGGRDALLYTADGGKTWQKRTAPSPGQGLNDLLFYRTGCGWVALGQHFQHGTIRLQYEHTLFFTSDQGRTWVPVLSGWKSVHDLCSPGPGIVWGVGNCPGFATNDLVVIYEQSGSTE